MLLIKIIKKKIILIDRFTDSTIAYQHYGFGVKRKITAQLTLERMYGKKFVQKLLDNYWAFVPGGAGMWKQEEFWKDKAEVE